MQFVSITKAISEVTQQLGCQSKAAQLFVNCFPNTLDTTTKILPNENTFVFTGDIPAMWLRDSSSQVRFYLPLLKDEADPPLADLIEGLIRQQTFCILTDPYANAFNEEPNGRCYRHDKTDMGPYIWERKYEIDSLCYPIELAYNFWKITGRTSHFTPDFHAALQSIYHVWKVEQRHEDSPYRFEREKCPPSDTLPNGGLGTPTAYTGMTWSGFRPSDDACQYGYLIPSNMFAACCLSYAAEIAETIYHDAPLAQSMTALQEEIRNGIETYGIVEHPDFGHVYAYEVDGMGHYNLMDDANVPSLLSIPYLGYKPKDDEVYQNTRRMILSKANPYYYEGNVLKGIGSPHTPPRHVWPISLAMQGLTSLSATEREEVLAMLSLSDGGTLYMHEGVHVDDPSLYTRSWFAWANSMVSGFIASMAEDISSMPEDISSLKENR